MPAYPRHPQRAKDRVEPVRRRLTFLRLQKKGNSKTGSEMQRDKESAAEIMRQKQAAGEFTLRAGDPLVPFSCR